MDLVDVVATHSSGRPVLATAEAMSLLDRVPDAQPVPQDRPATPLVIHRAGAGAETEALDALADLLGDDGIGILLLDSALTSLPLGDVLRTLGRERLRALSLHSTTGSGISAALVVTRDAGIPLRSHVLGEPFPTSGPEAGLRRDNEFVVESVVARAVHAELDRRVRGAADVEQGLRDEVERLSQQLVAETGSVADARAEVRRLERALSLVERRSPGYRALRLASKVRGDARDAGRQVMGRWGRKGP